MHRNRTFMVGAFLIGGLLLFSAGLFLIGDRRLLFVQQFEIYSEFGKVTGLEVGSRVRLAGLEAGEVLEIGIPSRPSQQFRVRMRLREDVHQLVRRDSVAAVQVDGIVGSAVIQVSTGTDASPEVAEGETIPGRDPVEFADLIHEGRETFRTVTREVVAVKADVVQTVQALTEIVESANVLVTDVGGDIRAMTTAGTRAAEDIRVVVADTRTLVDGVRAGRGTVGRFLTDDAFYERMTGIGSEAERTVRNLREATDRGRIVVDSITARDGPMQQMLQTLNATAGQAREVVSDLAESTEALKRNFLFRGFFRRRGFYDLNAISREAYASGALAGGARTPVRIWIDATVLFETGADGGESLTLPGRRRIDSAMADLVRYPRDSPLVVEGYAESVGGDPAFLRAEDRALLVREYILARFRRNATLVGSMSMSDQAPGSPRGDGRWSGVALALFVDNAALTR